MAPDEVKAHPIRPQVRLPQQAGHKASALAVVWWCSLLKTARS